MDYEKVVFEIEKAGLFMPCLYLFFKKIWPGFSAGNFRQAGFQES